MAIPPPPPPRTNPLDKQIGGNHYKGFRIQPIEFITKNELGFIPGCIIKRLCRYNKPGGKRLEDLQKAAHELQILIELEYAEPDPMFKSWLDSLENLNKSIKPILNQINPAQCSVKEKPCPDE